MELPRMLRPVLRVLTPARLLVLLDVRLGPRCSILLSSLVASTGAVFEVQSIGAGVGQVGCTWNSSVKKTSLWTETSLYKNSEISTKMNQICASANFEHRSCEPSAIQNPSEST